MAGNATDASVLEGESKASSVKWLASQTPDAKASKRDHRLHLNNFLSENRCAKFDTWVLDHFTDRARQDWLMKLIQIGIGDVFVNWHQFFEQAAVSSRHAQPLHILRCLDPTKDSYTRNETLVESIGMTARLALKFREGEQLESWHLDKYAGLLNWIARQYQHDYFFCLPCYPFHKKQDSTEDGPNLQTTLENFKLVGVPLAVSGSHWNAASMRMDGTDVIVKGYCSCSNDCHRGIRKTIQQWFRNEGIKLSMKYTKGSVTKQGDDSDSGVMTMLCLQHSMMDGDENCPVECDDELVKGFRYKMLERLLNHSPR